jgi:hypothetical protein
MTPKKILMAVALVATSSLPALAQSVRPHDAQSQLRALKAHASVYPSSRVRSTNRFNDVFDTRGRYVGSDPDPVVRAQMAHDPAAND